MSVIKEYSQTIILCRLGIVGWKINDQRASLSYYDHISFIYGLWELWRVNRNYGTIFHNALKMWSRHTSLMSCRIITLRLSCSMFERNESRRKENMGSSERKIEREINFYTQKIKISLHFTFTLNFKLFFPFSLSFLPTIC